MADQFSRFSDLPPELRVAIWILSLPPPFLLAERSLSITNRDEPMRILKTNPISNFFTPSKRSVPSVLHVCRESRSEFLAMGKTQTESQMVKRNGHRVYSYFLLDKNKGAVFFAAGCDVLLLTMDSFNIPKPYSPFPFFLLRHLVLITDSTHFFASRAADFLLPFSNLEILTIILKIDMIGSSMQENHYFPPEIDGQLDLESFSTLRRFDILDEMNRINGQMEVTRKRAEKVVELGVRKQGLWKVPTAVRWRLWEQFLEDLG